MQKLTIAIQYGELAFTIQCHNLSFSLPSEWIGTFGSTPHDYVIVYGRVRACCTRNHSLNANWSSCFDCSMWHLPQQLFSILTVAHIWKNAIENEKIPTMFDFAVNINSYEEKCEMPWSILRVHIYVALLIFADELSAWHTLCAHKNVFDLLDELRKTWIMPHYHWTGTSSQVAWRETGAFHTSSCFDDKRNRFSVGRCRCSLARDAFTPSWTTHRLRDGWWANTVRRSIRNTTMRTTDIVTAGKVNDGIRNRKHSTVGCL